MSKRPGGMWLLPPTGLSIDSTRPWPSRSATPSFAFPTLLNTVSRAPMDPPKGADPRRRMDRRVLVSGLNEAIGIALDVAGGRMFFTDLGGSVYRANLDGSNTNAILNRQGSLTGIAYALRGI